MRKIFILTLNWEGEEKLKALAPTLLNSLDGINFEWLVKDNASKDNSVDYLKSIGNNKINPIKYKDNLQNFSQGCNYLFNIVLPNDNDLILLLNNDVIFKDTMSIKNMISLLKDDVGAVGAKLLYKNNKRIQHAGVIFPEHGLPLNYRRGELDDDIASKNRYFQAITGAVMLMKADTYKNISPFGGLDNNLVWCFDDVDACLSIKYNQNKKIVYCGETNILHEESASLNKNPVNKLFMTHNVNYFTNKWKGRYKNDLNKYRENKDHNLI